MIKNNKKMQKNDKKMQKNDKKMQKNTNFFIFLNKKVHFL